MKFVKTLGLLAVSVAALMAFSGTASALTMTEGWGDSVDLGDAIHAASEGEVALDGTINIFCQSSTFSGQVNAIGSSGTFGLPVTGTLNSLTFAGCGEHTVTVIKAGSFWAEGSGGTGSNTGKLALSGTEITVLTHAFFLGTRHCIYSTNSTQIGTIRGTGHKENTNLAATLTAFSSPIPQTATDSLCGSSAVWTGSYVFNAPQPLILD